MPKRHSCGQFLCCTRQSKGASADESDLGGLEFPQEFPVHTIDLRDFKGKVPDCNSEAVTTEECNTSMEVLGAPSESVDEKGHQKGGSFSRRLQVEREEAKLERERKKVEKQRIRTLKCEEKLEKLKDRLIQSETIGQRSVGASFTGGSHTHSKQEEVWNSHRATNNAEETQKETEAPKRNSTEDTTPLDETNSETSVEEEDDEATAAQKSLTKSNIATLERANTQLLENLHKKEIEYAAVQEEVRKVNEKLAKVREDHDAEMARFHSDLAKGKFAGPVKLEVGELEATADELEEKIKMMENFGEKLASSMESAAIGKWQSIEAEDTVHKQLLELIEEMRNMLIEASQSKEYNEKIMALSNFETRYAQAMKLQVQMNNLRLSHLERNREIMVIKRQLLLQEVNNLLLQADITRKETELYQFQEAKIFGTAKKWYTSGTSERQRQQMQTSSSAVTSTYLKAGTQKEARPRQLETPLINIPYQSEEVTSAPPASSSSASHSTAEKADSSLTSLPAAVFEQLHFAKEEMGEEFTDQLETFGNQSACRGDTGVGSMETGLTQRPTVAAIAGSEQTTLSSPQFSEFANQVLSKKCPSELPFVTSSEIQKDPTFFPENSSKSVSETDSANDTVGEKSLVQSTQLNTCSKINLPKKALAQTEFTTVCDSVPLHNEIAELRRVKCEVEKEVYPSKQMMVGVHNPIYLAGKHQDNDNSLSASAPVAPGQVSLQKPGLEISLSLGSQPPVSAPESPESAYCTQQTNLDSKQEDIELADGKSQQSSKTEYGLESVSYTSNVNSNFSPASFNKSKVVPEQRESKDVQQMKTCTASPIDSHDFMKGKPPLPRHVTPVIYSTPVVPVKERGPRSKSVGDMDRSKSGSITSKPLQEVVSKFEKRANVCDTKDPQFSVRKIPSPTLHLPRVGLVSRVSRIKPSAELLAESRRYILGHAAHATGVSKTPSRSTVDYTAEGGKQMPGSTNDYMSEGSNQKQRSTVDYTPKETNEKSRPQDDILEGDSREPCSKEDHMLGGDSQQSGSINYDMQKADIQKSYFTNGQTPAGDSQELNSGDHAQEGDMRNLRSLVDYSLEGDNQASAFIKTHTPERDNKKLSCTKDHTPKRDTQTSSSKNDHTRQGDNQKFGSNEEHMQGGDNQTSNSRNSHRINGNEIVDNQSVSYTYTDRQSQDTTLAGNSRSRVNSDLLPKRTEEVNSQTQNAQRSNTHLLSQSLPDTSASYLNEQVREKQKTQSSNVVNDDWESKHPVRNVDDSEQNQQGNNSSAPGDLTQITKKNDGLAPAFNPELSISSSRSLIKDHGVHTKMSTSPYLLPDLSNKDTDHELHCEGHRNGAGASSGISRMKTKRNRDLLIQSASAPASPCPQHAEVMPKSKWKSERLSKEKISQPSPSPGKNRKSRRHNETIEALCKQSISAAINPALDETRFLTSQGGVISGGSPQSSLQSDVQSDQEITHLLSRRTQAEASPSSPVTKEKIKSTRILDTKWLQKSKKFFKVSK